MNAKRPNVTVVDHPLVQHKLTLMRKRETTTVKFRQLSREVSTLLAYEVTRDLPMTTTPIETPVAEMIAPTLAGKKLCVVSILRAGDGMLQGMLELVPSARVGHVGIYRDPESLTAVEYYFKVPEDLQERVVIVVDPMLATGNSAVAAVARIKEEAPSRSSSSACSPRRRASPSSRAPTPTCRSSPPRSTSASTTTATSSPASATPATASTAPSELWRHEQARVPYERAWLGLRDVPKLRVALVDQNVPFQSHRGQRGDEPARARYRTRRRTSGWRHSRIAPSRTSSGPTSSTHTTPGTKISANCCPEGHSRSRSDKHLDQRNGRSKPRIDHVPARTVPPPPNEECAASVQGEGNGRPRSGSPAEAGGLQRQGLRPGCRGGSRTDPRRAPNSSGTSIGGRSPLGCGVVRNSRAASRSRQTNSATATMWATRCPRSAGVS